MKKRLFVAFSALLISSSCMAAATGRGFENLIVCIFPHDSSTALELASNLMSVAASSPQSFGFALQKGAYGQYCQMAKGTPSSYHINNARLISSSGGLNYWVARHEKSAIGFTSYQ